MAKKKSIHRLIAIIGSAEKKLAFRVAITPTGEKIIFKLESIW